ncbi:MAG: hypothetical protein PHT48_09695 [Dechloromonas sp.]|nr:hypothetical protein [Dechloromonas sp.]
MATTIMKNLGDIIEMVRNGEKPDYEELRYAICAMDALMTFDRMALMKLAEAENDGKQPFLTYSAKYQYEENFNRVKRALEKSPKEFVGWNNDPENPEFLERRRKLLGQIKR